MTSAPRELKCGRCKGRVFVEPYVLDDRGLEFSCIRCGWRQFFKTGVLV